MQHSHMLQDVREGMKVFDSTNHEIGTVERVKFGDDDPDTPEPEASGVNPMDRDDRRGSLMKDLAEAFRADDLPEEVSEQLLLRGFVRIDADGLFNADRYVTPEQIDRVTGDALMLNVSKDELLKRH